jgi:hypothetical protein
MLALLVISGKSFNSISKDFSQFSQNVIVYIKGGFLVLGIVSLIFAILIFTKAWRISKKWKQ